MTVLIATDVFGITPAVSSLARSLGGNCQLVSPFDDERSSYYSERLAYQAFLAEGGVARYADKIQSILAKGAAGIQFAIGFSAGASALWLGSATPGFSRLQMLTLFYGSRIRDYASLAPRCPVRLVFAEREPAFDPAELVAELRAKGHSAEVAKNTSHGFMNPYSGGFCVKSQTRYIAELTEMLRSAEFA
ncbi:hypothetical protein [Undibacterium sp.]|jgi:dienelactone hydrolase|uniref:hypothetical protein n=1 Tax=Undibacterium sp. TaxID=1914977 RepID=UPI002B516DCA|nr:hypothetical protein [Undibacterium sp.]HTD03384.1 hypothetical protein [Undibacterium sp.]